MHVLHDLKKSISRPSMHVRPASSTKHSGNPFTSPPLKKLDENLLSPPMSCQLDIASLSASSSSTVTEIKAACLSETSLKSSSLSCTPEPDPYLISEPQPSAYWSGRFMSLYDKFRTEVLVPIPQGLAARASPPQSAFSSSLNQSPNTRAVCHTTQLPYSLTTSALTNMSYPTSSTTNRAPEAEEEITSRIFRRLEFFCSTDEARASLHEWQHSYARRTKQPHLLPQKHTEKRTMKASNWFGGSGRRSLTALRQATKERAGAKRVVTERPAAGMKTIQ